MDLIGLLITFALLFSIFTIVIAYRAMYIKGYRAGAKLVLSEWKKSLNEEEVENDGDVQ